MDRDEIIQKIAENIRIERTRKRMTQETLAEMADITQKYLNTIEHGRANPSAVVLVNICKALDVDSKTILGF